MNKSFHKPFIFWMLGIFVLYILLNVLLSGFYNTIPLITTYYKTVNWIGLSISIFFSLVIGALVAFNAVTAYIKYKDRQKCSQENTFTGIGAVGGLVTGVCPLCVTGFFPLIFSLVGISFSFASLPLKGLEVQIIVIIILAISTYSLNKR